MQLVTGNYLLDAVALFLRMMSPQEGGRAAPVSLRGLDKLRQLEVSCSKGIIAPKDSTTTWHSLLSCRVLPASLISFTAVFLTSCRLTCLARCLLEVVDNEHCHQCAGHMCHTLLQNAVIYVILWRNSKRSTVLRAPAVSARPPTTNLRRAKSWAGLTLPTINSFAQIQSNSNNASPFF